MFDFGDKQASFTAGESLLFNFELLKDPNEELFISMKNISISVLRPDKIIDKISLLPFLSPQPLHTGEALNIEKGKKQNFDMQWYFKNIKQHGLYQIWLSLPEILADPTLSPKLTQKNVCISNRLSFKILPEIQ